MSSVTVRTERNGPQMSDFEYLGRAYKDLAAQVVEEIIDEKGELREGYTA